MYRCHNFFSGPSVLPLEVLKEVQKDMLDYNHSGSSVMEISHRDTLYTKIDQQAKATIKRLLGIGDDYVVMFLQGGACTQFAMIPMNFLPPQRHAGYIITGSWSQKALKEAQTIGNPYVVYDGSKTLYRHIPTRKELMIESNVSYVHYTSNNTIYGTQFHTPPEVGAYPLICDASSDFMSMPLDMKKYSMIYACAQKNIGPAGVTVVIISKAFLEQAKDTSLPNIFRYRSHAEGLYNTPSTFNVYTMGLTMKWIEKKGGLKVMKANSHKKSGIVYEEIDKDDFYYNDVELNSRSVMNITFHIHQPELEETFIKEAKNHNIVGIKGHRSVGGMRVGLYNACPMKSVDILVSFMQWFRSKYG